MTRIYNPNTSRHPLNVEVRRAQGSHGQSIIISLPKQYVDRFKIVPGDLIRFNLHPADKHKMILEKIELDNGYDPGATPIGM